MAVSISWKRRVLFAIVAATVLVAITLVPSVVGAAPAKKYALTVSPTTATVGLPTTVTVTVTNETPPGTNSNFSSFYVTVPFLITGAIEFPPTPLAGSTNPNLSATVGVDPSNSRRILVKSLDAVNKGQLVKLTFTATPASCTPSNYLWVTGDSVKVANGASLNGDTFSPTTASTTVQTTVACGPPALSVTKTADAENVVAPNPIGYTITVNSSGGGAATGVTLTDALPTDAGLSWSVNGGTGAALCSITGGTLSCNFGDMANGSSFTVHISSPTTEATVADSPVQNTASVTATNVTPAPAPASASIDVFATTIVCGGTESASGGGTDVNVTLVDNPGCTPKNATITATAEDPVFQHKIEILASGSGGQVTFLVESTWAPESIPAGQPTPLTTVSPACAPGEGCALTSTETEVWCDGAFNEASPTLGAVMPAHHSWCRITQDTTIVEGGLKQVHEFSLLINPDPSRGR
jgi:uncharacterized repeat protein (TIGR01451 family)